MARMKTAVIYARFSCSKQREASITDQLRVCEEWCRKEGYAVVNRYCDHAISGRTDERPQFRLMIERAGESDIVLVYMMDRFSRDPYDAPIYKKILLASGVRVLSATETLPDGPEAILIEKIYEGMAAIESAQIAARTKRGMEGNALNCQYNGDRVYGYSVDPDTKRYVIDENEAALVRECFTLRLSGKSCNAIAKTLSDYGVRTYRGKPCSHTMVYNMLKNPRYKGVYKWGDVEVKGGMPAIVDEVTWDMAQEVKSKKNRLKEDWDAYALTGKAVCGGCGRNFVGVSGRGKAGVKYSYYRCSKRCGEVRPVPKAWLEDHVAEALREFVSDRERALEVGRIVEKFQGSSEFEEQAEAARKVISDSNRALAAIQSAIEKGIVLETTHDRIAELQEQRAQAETFLARRFDFKLTAENFADFLQYGATLTDEALIDLLVWQIVITEEHIIIALNYDVGPDIPQRLVVDGFSKDCVWDGQGREMCEHPSSGGVRTVCNWLTIGNVKRTHCIAVTLHSGRIAFVLSRAA